MSTGQHALLTPEATIEALAYLIANPVETGAVRYAKDWPGAHTLPRDIGARSLKVKRPTHYFDPDNADWPDMLELRLEMPTELEFDYGIELAQQRIAARAKPSVRMSMVRKRSRKKLMGLDGIGTLLLR